MGKIQTGLTALLSPKNSEFWTGLITIAGWIAVSAHWISPEAWQQWFPVTIGYTGARFISKVAKSKQ
jgi:hypothetical protein